MNVDPLAETMTRHSLYAYVFNNPMMFTDPTGMYGESIQTKYVNDRGDLLFETNDGSNTVVTVPQNKIGRFFNAIDATQDKELLNCEEWNFAMKTWIVGSWNRTMENTQSWYTTEVARRNVALYWQTGNIDYWSEAVSEHTGELRSDIIAWALGISGSMQTISIMSASRYRLGQSTVNSSLRSQKQLNTHTYGGSSLEGKSYLNSLSDAQNVLNSVQTGEAKMLNINTAQNRIYIEYNGVSGYYNNNGILIKSNRFLIKGGKSATVVPVHPKISKFK